MSNSKLVTEQEMVNGVTYTKKYVKRNDDKNDVVRRVLAQNPSMTNKEVLNFIEILHESH